MSLAAIKWAFEQPVDKSSAKFVLVAMADCANSESAEVVCWPSYKYLTVRTGLNHKTVESAVYLLKEAGFISDTGNRRGETGKVVVYRLNTPENGSIKPGPPEAKDADNTTKNGEVSSTSNDPVFSGNDPKNGDQSPQTRQVIPPKTGSRTSNESGRTRKEPGSVVTHIPGVPENVFNDWMTVRAKKLTPTGLAGLVREAGKAGLSVLEAVTFCCEAEWRGFNAGWYAERTKKNAPKKPTAGNNKYGAAARAIWGGNQSEVIDAETN